MPANTTGIEKRLWDAADDLRANSKLKSSEYSMPVLGLIFLRYADYIFNNKRIGAYNSTIGLLGIWQSVYASHHRCV